MFTHFYSDPHFGHENIIKHSQRPFADARHMEREFVTRYNDRVNEDDTVLWCGDCFFTGQDVAAKILGKLKGRKALVIGNHDRSVQWMLSVGFEFVATEMVLHIADRVVRVSHYPYWFKSDADDPRDGRFKERRPTRRDGEVLIHGHTHSKKQRIGNMVHVGVDAWDYAPVSFAEVEKLVSEAAA